MEAGVKGYVGKPYQLIDLLNTVREVLDNKE
jgi:DNA-binding response OmpR family regulator